MPNLLPGDVALLARSIDLRVSDAVAAALVLFPVQSPADVGGAASAAVAVLAATARDPGAGEALSVREPQAVHDEAARFFRACLDAQDRDEMRVHILRAIDTGARNGRIPEGLAPCVAAMSEARTIASGMGEAADCMSTSEANALFLECYDSALARMQPESR